MQSTMLDPTLFGRVLPNPGAGVHGIRSEFDRLFDQFLGPQGETGGAVWTPALDVWEDAEDLYVETELPGLSLDQIDLTLEREQLSIRGDRGDAQQQDGTPEGAWLHRERPSGRFERTITLPMPIDVERVEARLEHGVLTVRLPKAAAVRARKIQVQKA
jgi:HSP20 family protein